MSLLGCNAELLDGILNRLQWASVAVGEGAAVSVLRRKSQPPAARKKHQPRPHATVSSHSPFAELAALISSE
jgi:hypothetical protein